MFKKDNLWMKYAINLSLNAKKNNEVPVGSIIVLNNNIIGKGYNSSIKNNDPTAHAEILALRQAGKKIKNYRLINSVIYVTIEPCLMCIGAIINARIKRLVFGSFKNKQGMCGSFIYLLNNKKIIKNISITSGVLLEECSFNIKKFFKNKR
ncbi:tRNA adenosine(34) deaminase TadA [Sodalis-like secondary symbiont of Drepanosiphum platanoidis]|uniref:tRNA adenosine(34) deaminase TadA n=1 Tax=Sodalis-like secondary symbiont of Drepanosiphum platanoidis TaxID=2994493 RepID=UPI0034649C58